MADFTALAFVRGAKLTQTQMQQLMDNTTYLKDTANQVIYAENQQLASVNGGTKTSGSWETVTLNTKVFDPESVATLASDVLTVPVGTYIMHFWQRFYRVDHGIVRVFDTTASTAIGSGSATRTASGGNVEGRSEGILIATFSVPTGLRLETRVETTRADDGGGSAANLAGELERYAGLLLLTLP